MKFIDSHCHLDMEPLLGDQEGAIERANKVGVAGLINVGSSLRGSKRSIELSDKYPNIWASIGLHPHDADLVMDLEATIEELTELAKNDMVVAIGEIGLDYFDQETGGEVTSVVKESQKALFTRQLDLAKDLNLPVILHIRNAWTDTLKILKEKKISRGVVHCFTGNPSEASDFLLLGLYIGFTGFVTFEQPKYDQISEAAKVVPLQKILIETDAPFLAPEPYRGKTNEPAYVVEVAKKIAELKGISLDDIAEASVKNTKKVFNISNVI